MATWFKMDTAFFQNDRIIKAGTDGAIVFLQLLAINAMNSQDGLVSSGKADPAYLATLLAGLYGNRAHQLQEIVQGALKACEYAGLIKQDESGLRLVGFDATWKPPYTDAERAKRYRAARRKGAHIDPVTEPRDDPSQSTVTDDSDPSRTVTLDREIDREIDREEERDCKSPSPSSSVVRTEEPELEAASEQAAPAAAPRGTVEKREEKIGKGGRSMLRIMRGHGILARKQHALIDLVEQLQANGWTDTTIRWAVEQTQQAIRTGSWQASFVKEIMNAETRARWLHSSRKNANELRGLDHHFNTNVDARIREEAGILAEREGLKEWQSYERLIAGRYACFIGSGDSRNTAGDPWTVDDVPLRYRRHLIKKGTDLIAPLELQPFGKGANDAKD